MEERASYRESSKRYFQTVVHAGRLLKVRTGE